MFARTSLFLSLLAISACDDGTTNNPAYMPEDGDIWGVRKDSGMLADATVLHDATIEADSEILPDSAVLPDASLDAELETPDATMDAGLTRPFPDVQIEEIGNRFLWIDEFPGTQLEGNRRVVIYLPDGYYLNHEARYPVLYMHDGQNIFENSQATYGTEWQVDETVDLLTAQNAIEPLIVVGVYSDQRRMFDYTPSYDAHFGVGGGAEAYADFLINDLKPFIDAHVRTKPEFEHTGLLGSSLGGLVSLYISSHHPGVFSRVGAVSSSLFWNNEEGMTWASAIAQNKNDFTRLWLDGGSAEGDEEGEDSDNDGLVAVLDEARRFLQSLLDGGMTYGQHVAYFEHVGGMHNEATWAARLPNIIRFLFSTTPIEPTMLNLHVYGDVEQNKKTAWGNKVYGNHVEMSWANSLLQLTSSAPEICTVDNMHLTGHAAGNATITAKLGDLTANLPVHVRGNYDVNFNVYVPAETPADSVIYLAGSLDVLGNWEYPMHALTRPATPDGAWTTRFSLPEGTSFEYKVTRGTWETVEKTLEGEELQNRDYTVFDGDNTIILSVERWADQ